MSMVSINGVPVPPPDTYEVVISDLDASANRSANGTLFRDRVAVKRTINMSWLLLDSSELSRLLNSVSPVFVTVAYLDPLLNGMRTGEFYSADRPQGVAVKNADGSYKWRDISISLIER